MVAINSDFDEDDAPELSIITAEAAAIKRATSRASRKRNLLKIRDMLQSDILDPMTGVADRSGAVRSYVLLEQQLAVLLGESKPPTISLSKTLDTKGLRKVKQAIDVQAVARLMEAE